MTNLFSPEKYAAVRLPLHQASNLPSWCYTSPEWHERELDTIFRGPNAEWLCVGRADQIPNPGDFYTIQLVGQPLIVVRDNQNQVRVHSAICRHRGALIAEGEAGHCRTFVCPYHSWTYDLDGSLRATPGNPPPMAGVERFETRDYGLTPVRSDSWAGFVFVSFNPHPKPLLDWLEGLPAFLRNYDIQDMQFTHRDIYEVDCNWKVWLENAFENYHVPTIHRKHVDRSKPASKWIFAESTGPFEAMFSQAAIIAFSGLPLLPNLNDVQRNGTYHLWLQPTLQIILTSSYMKYRQYLPEGPGTLRLIENWAFPKTTVASPQFTETVGPSYYDKYAEVIREDLVISPNVQRGLASGAFRPGRYSLDEYIVHKIANYVVDRVVGPERAHATNPRRPIAAV